MLISSTTASSSDRSTSAFARVALLAFVFGMVDHEGNGRPQSQGNCRCETEMALRARISAGYAAQNSLREHDQDLAVYCPRATFLNTLGFANSV